MSRRDDAIKMLEGWWNAEDMARYYERWSSKEAAAIMKVEANDLREEILQLMGADNGSIKLADIQLQGRDVGKAEGTQP